ncbi:MAG: hypothetical protein E7388_02275 [Ruminococcaceae bacterium]|nr:hypothetical protein [Oscillospiraceae bacterium]
MKLPLIFTLVFALLAGSYTTPVEDTNTTIPPAVVKADAIAANDATQAEINPEIAPQVAVVEAVDASDESIHPTAAPVAIVNAIDAGGTEKIAPASQTQTAQAIDASDESIHPTAAPVAVVNAIDAGRGDTTSATKTITPEEAKQIALSHAKLTVEKVRKVKVEADKDEGKILFEVDFKHKGFEYEYEIDAKTGKILFFEKEWDD